MTDEAIIKPPRKKPSALSPTKRALAELKKRQWPCAIVEKWNQFAMVRQDLFGVFDLLALRPARERVDHPATENTPAGYTIHFESIQAAPVWRRHHEPAILGIQVTTASNRAARRDKLLASPYLAPWCACGGIVELWTYAKSGPRGKRKTWCLTVERIEPCSHPTFGAE